MQTRRLLLALRSGEISVEEARAIMTSPEPTLAQSDIAMRPMRADAVAIIGMSGRYPGAADLDEYWSNLRTGKESIKEIPPSRWADTACAEAPPQELADSTWLGMLDDIDCFDPNFFQIPKLDAHAMDPQHRLFLQEAYRAFEDAGYRRDQLDRCKCGVYLGISGQEYGELVARHRPLAASVTGSNAAIAAARIAYYLNLTGPALAIDTACSSSLVAAHLACQALRHGEIDLALSGGVSLYLGPERIANMSTAGMLSRRGQCRPFDNGADGFVPSEGVGALVLKRLADAERDGDAIHGLIIASGTNQNGSTNGITAPSKRSQIELLREVYHGADIDPATVTYVEAHATGTLLGDYIEFGALSDVFGGHTDGKQFCAIGSVKGNIGHATAAAGVASLHKVLLCLQQHTLVPTLHQEQANEHIDFATSPFEVISCTRPWAAPDGDPLRAAISAFGFSGSNAHLVLEEYVPPRLTQLPPTDVRPHVFVLSACDSAQLEQGVEKLRRFILARAEIGIASIAYSLQTCRDALAVRVAVVARSRAELLEVLAACSDGKLDNRIFRQSSTTCRVATEHERLAQAWVDGGVPIAPEEWVCLYGEMVPPRVHIPTIAFAQERYWFTALPMREGVPTLPSGYEASDETVYRAGEPYVRDHAVHGVPTLIGMTYVSLATDWFFRVFPHEQVVRLRKLRFLMPVEVLTGEEAKVCIAPEIADGEAIPFRALCWRRSGDRKDVVADGVLAAAGIEPEAVDLGSWWGGLREVDLGMLYGRNPAITVGETFRTVSRIAAGDGRILAELDATAAIGQDEHVYVLHPLIIYCAFQSALCFAGDNTEFLPFGIDEVRVRREIPDGLLRLAMQLRKDNGELVVFDAYLIDRDERVVVSLVGCSMKRLRSATPPLQRTGRPATPSPLVATSGGLAEIRRYLHGKLAALLGTDCVIDPKVNLMDMGATSAQLLSLTEEIERDLKIDLSPALLFEYSNVAELADYLHQHYGQTFAQWQGVADAKQAEAPPPVMPSTIAAVRRETAYRHASGHDDIAIIGMHGMLGGVTDLEAFWRALIDQTDLITEIPRNHWDVRPWYDPDPEASDKTCCKWGSFIPNVDTFDAEFFHISPREAEWMDPQLRLLLQSIYATAEDAGVVTRLRGTDTGVFVGVCCHDYLDRINERRGPVEPYAGLGNNHTVLANRISFAFDLRGPSVAVDTACSSSLVALHQACQSLRAGECSQAFVGGANLLLSSHHYRFFSSMGALSPTGRCHTFDESADGYVPAECVGSVLLKPLAQAEADGDRILAVVKGSASLHGGYTPSFTAPSVAGEENVIVKAWEDAGVSAETISYIEAHGTGTKLGDPIETKALTRAFARYTDRVRFCAVGSVKANIGHAEGAAGMASLFKVILQLRHRQIPAVTSIKQLNSLIKWDGTAIYANSETEPWNIPDGTPRRAGISSFGISGAYAHIVVEEYLGPLTRPKASPKEETPVAIVLSARDEGRLRERARLLADALCNRSWRNEDLVDIAYTLQTGREAMQHRMGVIAHSIGEIKQTLRMFAASGQGARIHKGQTNVGEDSAPTRFGNVGGVTAAERAEGMLVAWVRGTACDWTSLYAEARPCVVSLPTYPFARERHWLPEADDADAFATGRSTHPLLSIDLPGEPGTRFGGKLARSEFFFADHTVRGHQLLPGAAYLEMAREAILRWCRATGTAFGRVRLENVQWLSPLQAGERPVDVEVTLTPTDDRVSFSVSSSVGGGQAVLHCQAEVVVSSQMVGPPPRVDLAAIRAACDGTILGADWCYAIFRSAGVEYGPAFQGIRQVRTGQFGLLAQLVLPSQVCETEADYELHPSLIDSALQAGGLLAGSDGEVGPQDAALPFALEEVEIFDRCRPMMWAWVRRSEGAIGQLRKFDVDLCNSEGVVCVRIAGASSRPWTKNGSLSQAFQTEATWVDASQAGESIQTILAVPVWDAVQPEPQIPVAVAGRTILLCEHAERAALLCRAFPEAEVLHVPHDASVEHIGDMLHTAGSIGHLIWVGVSRTSGVMGKSMVAAQEGGVIQVFRILKALFALDYDHRALAWTVVTVQATAPGHCESVDPTHSGVHGLMGSLAHEYLDWNIRMVDLPSDQEWPIDALRNLPASTNAIPWSWKDGKWRQRKLISLKHEKHVGRTGYRRGGVYLVIGGAGGLGGAWTEYMIRTYQAQVVWVGRSPRDSDIERKITHLSQFGTAPEYLQIDATDPEQFKRAVSVVQSQFGALHGVVNAAIILLDQSLALMSEERFRAGYAAKSGVCVALAEALAGVPLDCILFFSSVISFATTAGQANYAAGCTFKDSAARRLARQLGCPVKVVNWGYWGSLGTVASPAYRERLARQGIGSIEPADAMPALELLLTSSLDQLVLVKAAADAVPFIDMSKTMALYCEDGSEDDLSIANVLAELRAMASAQIGVNIKVSDDQRELNQYGFAPKDLSLFARRVGDRYRINLTQATFIDQPSLPELAQYICEPSPLSRRVSPSSRGLIMTNTETHEQHLERVLAALLAEQLRSMGARLEPDSTVPTVMAETGIVTRYSAWLGETLRSLGGAGLLGRGAPVSESGGRFAEWDRCRADWAESPQLRAKVDLLDRTIRTLPSILTGETPATEVMFPDSSLELVEAIYRNNPEADAGREALAAQVALHLQCSLEKNPDIRFRVMEVGAGTGATTNAVLRALDRFPQCVAEYAYTDLSHAFLLHADQRFVADHPFVVPRLFDVELPPDGQGFNVGSYDVVIAANVLHATRSIRQTLRHVKALLKPGGLLIANELVGNSLFAHLTFGLLEGWWRYEDPEMRLSGCPGISCGNWRQVLEEEGLEPVFPDVFGADPGQLLIVAASDGVTFVARQNSERPSSFRVEAALSAITTNSTAVAGRTRQGEEVRARLRGELTELVADTLKFKAARIDANEPLETYGIDSLIVVRLTNELRKRLGKVSSTVFFENRTIAELVEHFAQTREGVLVERYGLSQPAAEEEKLVSSSLSVAPSADPETRDDIAIIGLAGRYPGANDVEEFWANLRDGKSAIGEIPADRWAWQNYYRDARGEPDAMYTRWGGFLTDVDAFDSLFFKISPAEAEKMDPQERLFLETAYASIEDAGYIPAELSKSRRVGVFVGVMNADYSTGAKYWSIANRVSYTFDLHGPSMAVDTACSSSLTAIHLAVESLRNGGCECAIAGGVNIIADPTHYLRLTAMTMLASDDRCKAFGDHADGFVASEGVGAIVLKPLARALADGDVIHGVIKASQVNSGGRTNGYSVPNPNAQAELVADALARSGCDARMVSYIEAHGTGTPLGDPIEVAGLARAFGKQTSDKHYCAIGSVKSNIGHGESVAGIAGLTKVLLQMRHGELVPSLHAETLNPEIHFDDTPFFVQRTRTNWTRPKMAVGGEQREMPRIAGISSFGAGGSNTHLIVAEPPELARIDLYECPSSRLFVLSARSYDRLQAKASQLVAALHSGSYSERDRASIAFTLQTGREPMEARLGFVACSLEEAEILLRRYLDGETTGLHLGNACRSGDTIGVALLDGGLAEVRSGEVLAQWVLGAGVDWARMWGDSMPRRLSLPAYPFAKRRHWLTNEFNHQKEQTMAPTCPPPPPTWQIPVIGSHIAAGTDSMPMLFVPDWREPSANADRSVVDFTEHLVLLCGDEVAARGAGTQQSQLGGAASVRVVRSSARTIEQRFEAVAIQVIAELQSILRRGLSGRALVQIVVPSTGADACLSALSGLARTAVLENPKLTVQLIELGEGADGLEAVLGEDAGLHGDIHVRHENGRRLIHTYREREAGADGAMPWRSGGIYLITGGAGGVGLLVAEDIARHSAHPRLILTGRSNTEPRQEAAIARLEAAGARVEYHRADVADASAMARLISDVSGRFGGLHGVLHCAGVLSDGYLVNKTSDQVRQVLAPKVHGVAVLDRASRDLDLDFFVIFSSVSATFGNVGQADYAVANGFLDAYATYRNGLVALGERHGRTLSINWPLWRDGGMRIDVEAEQWLREKTGMVALETSAAVQTLRRGIALGGDQLVVLAGRPEDVRAFVERAASHRVHTGRAAAPASEESALRENVVAHLKTQFRQIAKLNDESIDIHEPFESYGIDSVMIARWNRALEDDFGEELPKTMFFEQRTIAQAANYLLRDHGLACRAWGGDAAPATRAAGESSPSYPRIGETPSGEATASKAAPSGASLSRQAGREPIAIIGMSGRYPMADNLRAYWKNLESGCDCITEIPPDRWSLDGFYDPDASDAVSKGKSYSKWGGFVQSFAEFDPLFFRLSPREAFTMDPQERLFMVSCWEAMEDAGYTKESLAQRFDRNAGVFAGITKTGFSLYSSELGSKGLHTSFASAANRVSYLLDLRGPSMPVDTMCSSSLVAIHLACEHIINGECEMAFAGGVNLFLHPSNYIGMCAHRMLSVDGRCKSFGTSANGYVPGEGVGVVVLKRLSDAIADHDHIYAVIPATSVNHGGHTHGYTVPNPTAQRDLIRQSLDKAGIDARSVSYIEAHGTGTDLGDPIEVTALTQAFAEDTDDTGFCAIGSVKSNIGHLEAAAGIAGLTKVVLQMQHKALFPSLHADPANPNIRFERTPFIVQRKLQEWSPPSIVRNGDVTTGLRIAGVSSFGAGGTNAHVLLQEYVGPEVSRIPARASADHPALIMLSARNDEQLVAKARQLVEAIADGVLTDDRLFDAAFTLQVGREEMNERLAVAVGSVAELKTSLQAFIDNEQDIAGFYRGQCKAHNEVLSQFDEEDLAQVVDSLIAKGSFGKLLSLWVRGVKLDWRKLNGDTQLYRMSLPVYPFARDRYWVRDEAGHLVSAGGAEPEASGNTDGLEIGTASALAREAGPSPLSMLKPELAHSPRPVVPVRKATSAGRPGSAPIRLAPLTKSAIQSVAEIRPVMAAVEPERAQEQPTVLESPPVPALRTISAEDLESALTASLSAILFVKRSEIDLAKNFVDLGLDSIIGVEWIQALNNEYGLSMPASRIYSFPTMREFSKFVRKELDERPQAAPKAPPPVSSVAASPDVLRQLLDGIQQGSIEIDAAERLFQDLCQGVA